MSEYIDVSEATAIIEDKQKELCPTGRWSRNAVYGTDRETFDMWQEILDRLNSIEPADVAPVVHGRWVKTYEDCDLCHECSLCGQSALLDGNEKEVLSPWCPNCGKKMDGDRR